jgi:hypothetical protein
MSDLEMVIDFGLNLIDEEGKSLSSVSWYINDR